MIDLSDWNLSTFEMKFDEPEWSKNYIFLLGKTSFLLQSLWGKLVKNQSAVPAAFQEDTQTSAIKIIFLF